MQHNNKFVFSLSLILALILSVSAELFCAAFYVCRGKYSSDHTAADMLDSCTIMDYTVTPEGIYRVIGGNPEIQFTTDYDLGQIRISLKEAIENTSPVIFYYAKTPEDPFDTYARQEVYLLAGTDTAVINVRPGHWRSFAIDIKCDFLPESVKLIPAVSVSDLTPSMLGKGIVPLRFLLILIFSFLAFHDAFSRLRPSLGKTDVIGDSRPDHISPDSSDNSKPCRTDPDSSPAPVSFPKRHDRLIYLDLMRILAAFLVIAVHVVEPMKLRAVTRPKLYMLINAVTVLLLSCNILFIMISGSLLLDHSSESIAVFIKKRFTAVVIPLLIYMAFYMQPSYISVADQSVWVRTALQQLVTGNVPSGNHLWLIFKLIVLYIYILPLRYVFSHTSVKQQKLLLSAVLIIYFIRFMLSACGVDIKYFGQSAIVPWDYPGILIAGYSVRQDWIRKYDVPIFAAGFISAAVCVWLSFSGMDVINLAGTEMFLRLIICMSIVSAAIRLEPALQKIACGSSDGPASKAKASGRIFMRITVFLSKKSYSVLLIHWYVLYRICMNGIISCKVRPVLQAPLLIALASVISLILASATDFFVTDVILRRLKRCLDL